MLDFIETYDHALSPELCRSIIERFETSERRTAGRTGQGVEVTKKDSLDLGITGHSEWKDLHDQLNDATLRHLVMYVRNYPHLLAGAVSLMTQDQATGTARAISAEEIVAASDSQLGAYIFHVLRPGNLNVQKYRQAAGGYHHWHSEIYPRDASCETLHRVLLFMFYLNDVESGGETEFYYQQRKLRPQAGTMVIAPAGFTHTHKGHVPTSGDKYIVTSWILFQRAEAIYKK